MASEDKQRWPEFLNRFFVLSIILSVLYWVMESSVHPFFLGEGTFLSQALRPGGHELWMRAVVVCVILSFGTYAGVVVARLKLSREKARQNEARFRQIVETAEEGIWVFAPDGRTLFVNDKMAGLLGYAAADLYGCYIGDFVCGGAGSEGAGSDAGAELQRDLRLVRKDGSVLWAIVSSKPLLSSDGVHQSTLAMVTDITRHKTDEAALIEERNRAQTYLDVVGVMLVGLDSGGRVNLVNRKACELLGYTEQEVYGRDWFDDFIPEALRAEMREFFERVVSGDLETSAYYENPVLKRDGTERLIAWNNTVLRDVDGNMTSTISSGVDITEKRRNEVVLAERLDELERFRKATVARELRMKELKEKVEGLLNA